MQIDTRHPWRATIYHTLRTHIYIRAKPAAFVERRGVVHLCWFSEVRITAHFGSFFHVQSLPLCARKKKRQAVTQSLADAAKILHTAAIFFFQCSFFFFCRCTPSPGLKYKKKKKRRWSIASRTKKKKKPKIKRPYDHTHTHTHPQLYKSSNDGNRGRIKLVCVYIYIYIMEEGKKQKTQRKE